MCQINNIITIKSASKNYKIFEQLPNFVNIKDIMKMKHNQYPAIQTAFTALFLNLSYSQDNAIDFTLTDTKGKD